MSDQLTPLADLADQAPKALSTLESAETWLREVKVHVVRRRGQYINFKENTDLVTETIKTALPDLLRQDNGFLPKLRGYIAEDKSSKDGLSDTFQRCIKEKDYDGLLSSSHHWVEDAASPTIQALIRVREGLRSTGSMDSSSFDFLENSL